MATDDQETVALRDIAPTGALLKDRYLLGRQLGEGGFGTVFLARDQAMHERPVVVKIQLHQSMDDPWFERKFSEEVRALTLIDHPGVVSAIDSGRTPDGKPFLVMQYVDGVTLRTIIGPEGIPIPRAADILRQVGHALAAAHEKGIWHRDLKPENLMLQKMPGGGERVRLIDFGIATVADLGADPAKTRVAGSLAYMAPEQRMGQPSAAADIYAMGLIAYELLTGSKPFPDPRPVSPASAERLIMLSLAREPGERPVDAREFGDQLYRSLVNSEVTRLTIPSPVKRGGVRKLWLAAAVMASALGAVAYFKVRPPVTPPPVAVLVSAPVQDGAVELVFWNSVKDSTDPRLYREYLAKYPKGQFASLANAKLASLEKPIMAAADPSDEKDAWNEARRSREPKGFLDYLDRYPKGKHASDARKKLTSFQKQEVKDSEKLFRNNKVMPELNYWRTIQLRNDPEAYREYLEKYPKGLFAPFARRKLDGTIP